MSERRRVIIGSLAAVLLWTLAATAGSPEPARAAADPPAAGGQGHVVRVYYFHTTQRCASCRKIEALSSETIRTAFEKELGDGRLEFQVVNIEEPSNRHFVADFALYTKSLVVVDLVNGRQVSWKNLEKIWELLRDDAAFRQYVKGEVAKHLEKPS